VKSAICDAGATAENLHEIYALVTGSSSTVNSGLRFRATGEIPIELSCCLDDLCNQDTPNKSAAMNTGISYFLVIFACFFVNFLL